MSATIAVVAASAAVNASIAASSARHEAERARCLIVDRQFDVGVATVDDKQEYAQCVYVLHPIPHEPLTNLQRDAALAALVVIALSAIYGAWKDGRDRLSADGLFSYAVGGLMYAMLAACVVASVWALAYGFVWVLA